MFVFKPTEKTFSDPSSATFIPGVPFGPEFSKGDIAFLHEEFMGSKMFFNSKVLRMAILDSKEYLEKVLELKIEDARTPEEVKEEVVVEETTEPEVEETPEAPAEEEVPVDETPEAPAEETQEAPVEEPTEEVPAEEPAKEEPAEEPLVFEEADIPVKEEKKSTKKNK